VRGIAKQLAGAVEKELSELAMEGSRFAIELTPLETLAPEGAESARLLFSANRGEALKTLVKVASGGELSRLLLAVKLVLSAGESDTFIFDEIDAGISGRQAEVVGKKLKVLAVGTTPKKLSQHQVFCVTHLAPVAAFADQHLKIAKQSEGGRTVARVAKLDSKGRTEEIARLLAGEKITPKTLAHAEEMLQNSAVM
jgi:DNA repair protein RecN (Recombination protein N)